MTCRFVRARRPRQIRCKEVEVGFPGEGLRAVVDLPFVVDHVDVRVVAADHVPARSFDHAVFVLEVDRQRNVVE
jgi:hypothetical protein